MENMELKHLKPLVNSHDMWNILDKYLELCYNRTNQKIDQAESIDKIQRLIGERICLTRLRQLKEIVNNAEQN